MSFAPEILTQWIKVAPIISHVGEVRTFQRRINHGICNTQFRQGKGREIGFSRIRHIHSNEI